MFGVYAAEVQFRHERAERDRDQRHRVLRAERLMPDPPLPARRALRTCRVAAWPRPIRLRATGDGAFAPSPVGV